jgi:hypothetical protein
MDGRRAAGATSAACHFWISPTLKLLPRRRRVARWRTRKASALSAWRTPPRAARSRPRHSGTPGWLRRSKRRASGEDPAWGCWRTAVTSRALRSSQIGYLGHFGPVAACAYKRKRKCLDFQVKNENESILALTLRLRPTGHSRRRGHHFDSLGGKGGTRTLDPGIMSPRLVVVT